MIVVHGLSDQEGLDYLNDAARRRGREDRLAAMPKNH